MKLPKNIGATKAELAVAVEAMQQATASNRVMAVVGGLVLAALVLAASAQGPELGELQRVRRLQDTINLYNVDIDYDQETVLGDHEQRIVDLEQLQRVVKQRHADPARND